MEFDCKDKKLVIFKRYKEIFNYLCGAVLKMINKKIYEKNKLNRGNGFFSVGF
jgi:hypothetical protein